MSWKCVLGLGLAPLVAAGCHPVDRLPATIQFGITVNDWHGDFLGTPVTGLGYSAPDGLMGQLAPWVIANTSACCNDPIRVFRLADGSEVSGGMRTGNVTIDGRIVPPPTPMVPGVASGFVARGALDDGWYLAALDARPYRPFGPLARFHWVEAVDDVAFARFQIGRGVDWVQTYPVVREDEGTVDIVLLLSSPLPAAQLEGSRVEVRRAGILVDCTPASTGEDPTLGFGVTCQGLTHGDTIEVRLDSDRVGHPMGELRPQEILLDRDGPLNRRGYPVAPELGLDVLRAAYGIEGDGV